MDTLLTIKEPATNKRLAQWWVTWLIEHSTSHQLLWCVDSFVLRNPPSAKTLLATLDDSATLNFRAWTKQL